MNYGLLFKAINYVRNLPSRFTWDFSVFKRGNRRCFVGACKDIMGTNEIYPKINGKRTALSLTNPVAIYLFPSTPSEDESAEYLYCKAYKKTMDKVTKEDVCNLVEKYVRFKIRQEHKWKQYEYKIFGVAVTNKRGVTI